jgi:hypothetical protein
MNSLGTRTSVGRNNNLAFQGDLGLDHKFDDNGHNLSIIKCTKKSQN